MSWLAYGVQTPYPTLAEINRASRDVALQAAVSQCDSGFLNLARRFPQHRRVLADYDRVGPAWRAERRTKAEPPSKTHGLAEPTAGGFRRPCAGPPTRRT